MSKRMRTILAIVTGLVTLFMAYQLSFATEAEIIALENAEHCTIATRKGYENQRTQSDVEQSPDYRLGIAEDFLTRCDLPLHVQAVAKHAARAALDAGQPEKALQFFERALDNGTALTDKEQLDYILSLWLNGDSDRAWTLRDDLIEDWLDRAANIAEITSTNVRDGIIHKVEFSSPAGNVETRIHWLAQPHGEGWPAAMSLDADPALIALATFRVGQQARSLQDLTLVQCRGRKTALRSYGDIDAMAADMAAIEALKVYLSQPQTPHAKETGQPAAACYSTDRLFVPLN